MEAEAYRQSGEVQLSGRGRHHSGKIKCVVVALADNLPIGPLVDDIVPVHIDPRAGLNALDPRARADEVFILANEIKLPLGEADGGVGMALGFDIPHQFKLIVDGFAREKSGGHRAVIGVIEIRKHVILGTHFDRSPVTEGLLCGGMDFVA